MNRSARVFLVAPLLVAALASSVRTRDAVAVASAAGPPRPNVLIIVTDDHRAASTMDVMPQTMRRFGKRGVTFPNGFATTPQCCPSRASIMTGRFAHNHGVGNNSQAGDLDHSTTLQRYLSEAGYRTGLVGKFLNGWPLSQPPPYFERYWLFTHGYYDRWWNINGAVRFVSTYSTTFIKKKAVSFIREGEDHDRRPWLLYVTPWAPHMTPVPEPKYEGARVGPFPESPAIEESDCSDKPPWVDCDMPRGTRRIAKQQKRTLMSVDDLVARVMKVLGETGENSNTLAFFLSDNGMMWGEHGLREKRAPYTDSVMVPLMMRYPGRVESGSTDERLVANIDIAPTVVDAADVRGDNKMDGRSLLDAWERDRMHLEYKEYKEWPDWLSTRTPTYQYTEYYDTEGALVFREYYDLVADPWQLDNLLGDADPTNDPSADELARLSEQLRQDASCSGDQCPGGDSAPPVVEPGDSGS